MAHHTLPIIILAAGSSSRMRGRDKLLEKVDGAPLLRQQVMKAKAATRGPVLVALPPKPNPRYTILDNLDVQIVVVEDADEGMNASLRASFAALPKSASCAMLLLGDLPDITSADLEHVADAVDLDSATRVWRGATKAGSPGHPIVFHASLFPAFAALTGDSGGREVIAQSKGQITLIPLEGDRARHDLDTPEAWDLWRASRTKNTS